MKDVSLDELKAAKLIGSRIETQILEKKLDIRDLEDRMRKKDDSTSLVRIEPVVHSASKTALLDSLFSFHETLEELGIAQPAPPASKTDPIQETMLPQESCAPCWSSTKPSSSPHGANPTPWGSSTVWPPRPENTVWSYSWPISTSSIYLGHSEQCSCKLVLVHAETVSDHRG